MLHSKIATIKKRLLAFNSLTSLLEDGVDPTDFPTLKRHVIITEMRDECVYLESLLESNTLTLETLKEAIKQRCAERAAQNTGTSLGFSAFSTGDTNTIYQEIVNILFSPKNITELLSMLSPQTMLIIRPSLPETLPPEFKNRSHSELRSAFRSLSYQVVTERINEIEVHRDLPLTLSDYVFFKDTCIYVGEIAELPFKGQMEFYESLEITFRGMHHALYSHNSTLSTLKDNILMYKEKGLTPRHAMETFSKRLLMGAQYLTGQVFAQPPSILACGVFGEYLALLDDELRERVYALEAINGKSLSQVLLDLDRANCVQIASFQINAILENEANKALLDTHPGLSSEQVRELENQYNDTEELISSGDESYLLPITLLKKGLGAIKIENASDLINLLINFDLSLYDALLSEITITGYKNSIFFGLVSAINNNFYSEEQTKALRAAVVKNISRFLSKNEVLFVLMELKSPIWLSLYLESLTDDERSDIVKEKNRNGTTVLHLEIFRVKRLKMLLGSLPPLSRIEVLTKKNKEGDTVLHLACSNPQSLKMILELLPARSRIELIKKVKETNEDGRSVLHIGAFYPGSLKVLTDILPEPSFPDVIKTLKEKDCYGNTGLHLAARSPENLKLILSLQPKLTLLELLNEINKESNTALHLAAFYPKSLKIILELYPEVFRLDALKEKNREGTAVLDSIMQHTESLKVLFESLSVLSRIDIVKEKNEEGYTRLHLLACNPKCLKVLLEAIPESARLEVLREKTIYNETVFHLASNNPESLKVLFESVPKSSHLEFLKEKTKYDDTLLHLAASRNPESLDVVLSFYPKSSCLEAVREINGVGNTVLHLAAHDHKSLALILSLYSKKSRLNAVKKINKEGDTVLHLAAHNEKSLKILLAIYHKSSRLEAVKQNNWAEKTVLHLAANHQEKLKGILSMLSEQDILAALKLPIGHKRVFWKAYFNGRTQLLEDVKSPLLSLLSIISICNRVPMRQGFFSHFFYIDEQLSLEDLLRSASPTQIAESVLIHLNNNTESEYNKRLLNQLILKYHGDMRVSTSEKLIFLENSWRGMGLLSSEAWSVREEQSASQMSKISHVAIEFCTTQ